MPNTSISFPTSPTINQQYVYGSTTYVWNGTSWATLIDSSLVVPINSSFIIYSPTGTGAVTRNAANKFNDILSVKDFGAVGNGTTNDTAAFNAAWSAQNPNPVLVPPGNYVITGTVIGEFYTFGTVSITGGTVNTINRFTKNLQVSGNTTIGGDLTLTNGDFSLGQNKELRLSDSDSSNYIAFKSPANVTNNNVYTLPAAVGSAGQVLQVLSTTSNNATLQWATLSGSPGGSNTQVQFNDSGAFGGDSGLTYNKTTDSLTLTGDLAVNGGDITTTLVGTASVFNSSATTLNIGGAAGTVNLGSSTGAVNVNNLSTTSTGTASVGNLSMNAGYGSIAPVYGCRAWVNFNGIAASHQAGTYTQSGTTVTVSVNSHGLYVGSVFFIDITSGSGVDGTYTVVSVPNGNQFTYNAAFIASAIGNCALVQNAIRGSGNVSSIADRAIGRYSVNFITPMPDINYAVLVTGSTNVSTPTSAVVGSEELVTSSSLSRTTASVPITFYNNNFAAIDALSANIAIFR